ncbi:MAG: TetR/AcrR family transcriptional regulator [Solirubrobacterales bacterium]
MRRAAAPAGGPASTALRRAAAGRELGAAVSTPLYSKLKPRPNGPGRERVARHQRARLHGATIAAVAARGYPALTVSQLVALAGISRRTFYEHFADREACFLASYDAIVAGAARRAGEAAGLGPAFEALAHEVAAKPQAARLALVEILAAGPVGLERIERTRGAVQRTLAERLCEPQAPPPPPAVLQGIAGGIWHVARRRLLEDAPHELPELAGGLHAWALACGSPAAAELPIGAPTVASLAGACHPGGRDEHRLILRTAAELAAREGYAQVSTGRIADEAGVPEALLRERYGSGEECFLAALELLTAEALAGALRDAQQAPDWPTGVQRALATLMRHVAHDRAFAQIAFVEVFAAGPGGLQRGEGLLRSLAELLLRYAPRAQRPSPLAAEAAVGGIWEIIHHHVAHRTVQQLPGLAASAAYLVLAPAIGPEEAVRSVRAGS